MERLIDNLLDPVNRLYRHRIAKGLANLLSRTGISPNQVTILHTLVGIYAAFLVYQKHYILAVVFFEIRTLLDCTDGILARLTHRSSTFGRFLDTIGDGISFNALMIIGALRMIQDFPSYRPSLILIIVFCFALTATHCGMIYQLMKRKLLSILSKHVDTVEIDWRVHRQETMRDEPSFSGRFGYWMDSFMIRFISEEWFEKMERRLYRGDWESRALNDAVMMNELARTTRRRELRNAVRFTSLVSDDNIFSIMSLCFLILGLFPEQIFPYVHPVLVAFSIGFVYAIVVLPLSLHYFHEFYHGVYRE